jgi:hypothetical protein
MRSHDEAVANNTANYTPETQPEIDYDECWSCSKPADPKWAIKKPSGPLPCCSEAHFDEWVQFGRYGQ